MNKEETILTNIDTIKDSFYTDILDIPTKEDILNQAQCCIIYLQEENKILKNRIDKAIEYIEENEKEYGSLEDNEKIILDILRGEDNDNFGTIK